MTWNTDFIIICQNLICRSVYLISKPISYLLTFIWLGFLPIFYPEARWSSLDHDLMASIWKKSHFNFGRKFEFRLPILICFTKNTQHSIMYHLSRNEKLMPKLYLGMEIPLFPTYFVWKLSQDPLSLLIFLREPRVNPSTFNHV